MILIYTGKAPYKGGCGKENRSVVYWKGSCEALRNLLLEKTNTDITYFYNVGPTTKT